MWGNSLKVRQEDIENQKGKQMRSFYGSKTNWLSSELYK